MFSILMLVLQFGVAASPNIPVAVFWGLVLLLCVYVLFFKKPRPKAS